MEWKYCWSLLLMVWILFRYFYLYYCLFWINSILNWKCLTMACFISLYARTILPIYNLLRVILSLAAHYTPNWDFLAREGHSVNTFWVLVWTMSCIWTLLITMSTHLHLYGRIIWLVSYWNLFTSSIKC
jgi:hypothetical protein